MESRRGTRRAALAYATAAACLVLSVPGFAGASESLLGRNTIEKTAADAVSGATSTVEDAVESVLDSTDAKETTSAVTDRVKDTAKPVTDPVTDVLKPVTDTVDEATKPVTDTVDEVTKPVTDKLGDATKPVTDVVAPPQGGRDHGTTGISVGSTSTTGTKGSAGDRGPRNRDTTDSTAPAGRKQRGAAARRASAQRPTAATADPRTTPVSARTKHGASDRSVADIVGDVSRAFRFPLLLMAALALFLAAQSRLDGRDPKLSAGADEELSFA